MSATGQNMAGTQLYTQGQYYAAVDRFQQALAYDPANADAYYNMAATYHQMGKTNTDDAMLNQAESMYNRCLDLSPDHADCHRGLAVLLVETDRQEKAFTLLERWVERSPQVADPRIELARLNQEFGDKEVAKRQLEQAVSIDANSPSSARAWAALAQLREESGDTTQALADYERSYHLNNFQPAVAQRIASLRGHTLGVPAPISNGGTRIVTRPGQTSRY